MKNIRETCDKFVCVHCNARTRIIRMLATLPEFGTVWFDDRCTTNIIYLLKSKNRYRVMYD